jgi:hypothetical protein
MSACRCVEPVDWLDVADLVAIPFDDLYSSMDCVNSCKHAGSPSCPPYREWIVSTYLNGDEGLPQIGRCPMFQEADDAYLYGG